MYELINHLVHKLSKHALQQVKYIDFFFQSIKLINVVLYLTQGNKRADFWITVVKTKYAHHRLFKN